MKKSVTIAMLGALTVGAVVAVAHAGSVKEPAAAGAHAAPAPAAHGTQTAATPPAASSHGPAWTYTGPAGPERWATLSRDFELCGIGSMQSPIDMSHFNGASVEPIAFDYKLSPLEIVHNGHTVQVNFAPGSGITVEGKRFELLQTHFHMPSEHSLGGRQSAMELHLVHKSAAGELAVIGVMMEVGDDNMALSEFWGAMPQQAGPPRVEARILINARDLLPSDTGYYRYMGSLTTPPCSEGVNWFVMREPVSISPAQIERFAAAVGENARPVQPVNQRFVLAPLAAAH
jgi:carbonic anhydrase